MNLTLAGLEEAGRYVPLEAFVATTVQVVLAVAPTVADDTEQCRPVTEKWTAPRPEPPRVDKRTNDVWLAVVDETLSTSGACALNPK